MSSNFEIAIPFIVLVLMTIVVVVVIIRSAIRESEGREARQQQDPDRPNS